MRDLPLRCSRQSFQRPASLQLAACLYGACPGSFLPFFGVRRTRFGFGDAFGFVAVVAGFKTSGSGAGAAAGLAGFFFLRLGFFLGP